MWNIKVLVWWILLGKWMVIPVVVRPFGRSVSKLRTKSRVSRPHTSSPDEFYHRFGSSERIFEINLKYVWENEKFPHGPDKIYRKMDQKKQADVPQ